MLDIRRNIKLILSYDGTQYSGWQIQKDRPTIQGIIEQTIYRITKEEVKVIGSGRTDAGVHAIAQVCNFKTESKLPPDILKKALNSLLPQDIYVKDASICDIKFHARYNAKSKTYQYRILNTREPDIFLRRYVWHISNPLDVQLMKKGCCLLQGVNNFSAFKSTGSGNRNPVRNMIRSEVSRDKNGIIIFEFEADGFLRHMVRNIVGTIVDVGSGKLKVEEFRDIFHSRDRKKAGIKAPPQGLFLKEVKY